MVPKNLGFKRKIKNLRVLIVCWSNLNKPAKARISGSIKHYIVYPGEV